MFIARDSSGIACIYKLYKLGYAISAIRLALVSLCACLKKIKSINQIHCGNSSKPREATKIFLSSGKISPNFAAMQLSDLRIIFLGTPEFAAYHLKAMLEANCQVLAVITNQDKQMGRGLKLHASPVKLLALKHNIPVLCPAKLKDPEFLAEVRAYKPDLQVVVAFRMLPEVLWNLPPLGTINMHASYLPNYRGAAPIQRVIMDGAEYTGVSTFQLRQAIDTGAILLREKIPLSPNIDGKTLHDQLMHAGSLLLLRTLKDLAKGELQPVEQAELLRELPADSLRLAPKIHPQDCRISWNNPGLQIARQIRALSPYPGAFTSWQRQGLKVLAAEIGKQALELQQPGTWQVESRSWRVFTQDGYLELKRVQLAGKKALDIGDFLNGRADLVSGARGEFDG